MAHIHRLPAKRIPTRGHERHDARDRRVPKHRALQGFGWGTSGAQSLSGSGRADRALPFAGQSCCDAHSVEPFATPDRISSGDRGNGQRRPGFVPDQLPRRSKMRLRQRVYAAAFVLCFTVAARADNGDIVITIKDGKFAPSEVHVPANTKLKLIVRNQDSSMSEFESVELHCEKTVTPVIRSRPLLARSLPGS